MDSSIFIAKKLIKSSKTSKKNSQAIIRIAIGGTILSTLIMVLTIFISFGFKHNILNKVKGFSSDIQIINYDANQSYDLTPISLSDDKLTEINNIDGFKSLGAYITKPAILKYKDNIEGIVLKSYQDNSDFNFFNANITKGKFPDFSKKEILVSEHIAKVLKLDIGSSVLLYFIQDPIRYRKLKVSGFYKTDIYEFDHLFAVIDIITLRKLNQWEENQYSGYEINISNDKSKQKIESILKPKFFDSNTPTEVYKVLDSKDRYPQFYYWFDLFDTNVYVIIFLMIAVAAINLISALLIIIIENTRLVGLLKSFGSDQKTIRRIFLYFATYLATKGLIWGNISALIIAYVQYQFKLMPLDAENYHLSYVPIGFDWFSFIILNFATIIIIFAILILPSSYISKISPIKVIRFN